MQSSLILYLDGPQNFLFFKLPIANSLIPNPKKKALVTKINRKSKFTQSKQGHGIHWMYVFICTRRAFLKIISSDCSNVVQLNVLFVSKVVYADIYYLKTRQKLWQFGYKGLVHPPYSFDLAPSGLFLFTATYYRVKRRIIDLKRFTVTILMKPQNKA